MVSCDVVDMDACVVLLGCSWEFDIKELHKGKKNFNTFVWNRKKIIVLPLRNVKNRKEEGAPIVAMPIDVKEILRNIEASRRTLTLIIKSKVKEERIISFPQSIETLLAEFPKLTSESLKLPPTWNIQY